MQDHDWNDLRYILALHRTGRLSEAGRSVAASETTVARRIRRLEQSLDADLFVRNDVGRYVASDFGLQVICHAESIEQENIAIRERAEQLAEALSGVVRVTSVPIIINRILVPNFDSFKRQHPGLTVELVPESRNVDLSKREADLAVRFSRPVLGGLQVKAQKLGALEFGAYVPSSVGTDEADKLSWIGYDDARASLPQARWLNAAIARSEAPHASLHVSDAVTALEAVACGLGKTILPRIVANSDQRLRALTIGEVALPPVRDVWLLSHTDQNARASIVAVKAWLAGLAWNDIR